MNLDNYLSSGNYYEGTIYLSGHLVISGSVVVEPAEDTSWEKFYPKQPLISSKTAFSEYLTDIALNGKVFNAPEIADTNPGECWRAEATISIDGIVVRLYDDSTRGASFDGVKVLKLSRYKKCSTQ